MCCSRGTRRTDWFLTAPRSEWEAGTRPSGYAHPRAGAREPTTTPHNRRGGVRPGWGHLRHVLGFPLRVRVHRHQHRVNLLRGQGGRHTLSELHGGHVLHIRCFHVPLHLRRTVIHGGQLLGRLSVIRLIGFAWEQTGLYRRPVGCVLSSEYCRARETAELMGIGDVTSTGNLMNMGVGLLFSLPWKTAHSSRSSASTRESGSTLPTGSIERCSHISLARTPRPSYGFCLYPYNGICNSFLIPIVFLYQINCLFILRKADIIGY
jgi:hypothetical protein